jgi:hypothetical protein
MAELTPDQLQVEAESCVVIDEDGWPAAVGQTCFHPERATR